jgi:hypothetical protein
MKQTIILLTMVILGIAISAMILGFEETTESITAETKSAMVERLDLD